MPHAIERYVALGDSFSEGLNDRLRLDGRHRGWADRVAEELPTRQGIEQVHYANLAVRGRLTSQVIHEQVPMAIELGADTATLGTGINDALRRSFDIDAVVTDLEFGVRELRRRGIQVLLFAFGDTSRRSRAFGRVGDRIAGLRSATLAIAQAYHCPVVDFWGVSRFDDDRLWSTDRLHLGPEGHAVVAQAVLAAWGLGDDSWRSPDSDPSRSGWLVRRGADVRWAGSHAAPWLSRRVRGVSSGDGVIPKDSGLRTIEGVG